MTPIEIACRHVCHDGYTCAAEVGQKCDWSECDTEPYPMGDFHRERIEDAASMSNGAGKVDPMSASDVVAIEEDVAL